ncbi:hypothetical protein KFE94_17000 [bacterium SCSIO 12643]|nr:hypothetical protein KFE94_17000 [bacterium SCSIO 12643]
MRFIFTFLLLQSVYLIQAQDTTRIQGTFYGKINPGGFVDTLNFNQDTLTLTKNRAFGYGMIHMFRYKVNYAADSLQLIQVGYWYDGEKRETDILREMNGYKVKYVLSENGFIWYDRSSQRLTFEKL